MRATRPKHSELATSQRLKANTRAYTHQLVKRGTLAKIPCKCGSLRAEAHHHDYGNPFDVEWLCRPCHLELHAEARAA